MSVNMYIITAVAVSTPVALYMAFRWGVLQQYIEVVKNRLSSSDSVRKYIDVRVEDLRKELASLRDYVDRYREKIDILENRLKSLEEKVDLIDKKTQSIEVQPSEDDDIVLKVVELRKKGYSLKRIAEELDIPLSRVRKILKLKSNTAD